MKSLNEEKLFLMKKQDKKRKLKESLQMELCDLSQKAQLLTNAKLMLEFDKMEDEAIAKEHELSKCENSVTKILAEIDKYGGLVKFMESPTQGQKISFKDSGTENSFKIVIKNLKNRRLLSVSVPQKNL